MPGINEKKAEEALNLLTAAPEVKAALAFIEQDRENVIQKQIELTLIPAPTFHEEKKAARLAEMFREEGLEDVHIDSYGNCCGVFPGSHPGPAVLVEAHMDTVFPEETKLDLRREDGWIYCPGIVDDTRGCAMLLGAIRAMKAAGIVPGCDIRFVGTVQEEGTGALRGMRHYMQAHHAELKASVSVDGEGYQGVIFQATGIQTYEIAFHGIGGHASGAFAKVANPIHAAGRMIAKIADFRLPEGSRTTFAVTNLEAGNISSVHAIVKDAVVRLNFRALNNAELEEMRARIFAAADEACREETERWGKDTITWTGTHICDISANPAPADTPLVQGAVAASRFLGCEEPELKQGGATNCSRALEAGVPAICLGPSDYDSYCHTEAERFREADDYKGTQYVLLNALLAAGACGVRSVMDE